VQTNPSAPTRFEFSFPQRDTLLLVEVEGSDVTIRATRDTFSSRRKASFVRELAAEGFIPGECQWRGLTGPGRHHPGVRWLVDPSWLSIDEAAVAQTQRTALQLCGVAALLLWLVVGLTSAGRPAEPRPAPVAVPPHSVPIEPPAGIQGLIESR